MKTLIVYDSNYGNTEEIAKEISSTIGKNAQTVRVLNCSPDMLADQELLIVGSPINGWRPTVNLMELLKSLPQKSLAGVMATTFDTRLRMFFHGDAMKKIADMLTDKGAHIITEPRAFYVNKTEGPLGDGELKNAQEWARAIIEAAGTPAKRL